MLGEELDIEYCRSECCEDIYATYPQVWLCFRNLGGETFDSSEDTFRCPRCHHLIRRHTGFLKALERRDSPSFINNVLADISDLSQESLNLLRAFLTKFSVPSFAVFFEGTPGDNIDELVKKRYIEVIKSNDRRFAVLNAYKLFLLDEKSLLEVLGHQQGFILYPEYVKANNEGGKRRKARMEALVDDFTDGDRTRLLTRFEGRCALTGNSVPLQVDHVLPVAIGHGGTTLSNLLPIGQRLNSSKGAKNIFEWYEENGDRFEVLPELFDKAIEYLADLNDMSPQEYRDYVYECHANPNDILTEVI